MCASINTWIVYGIYMDNIWNTKVHTHIKISKMSKLVLELLRAQESQVKSTCCESSLFAEAPHADLPASRLNEFLHY